MLLVVVVAALAAAVVVAAGGVRRLSGLDVRAVRLLAVAAALALAPVMLAPTSDLVRLVSGALSLALVALFLAGNARLAGVPLIAAGLVANVLVILANGAMPVSTAAAERLGISDSRLQLVDDPLHEPLTSATRFAPLADQIPVALPWYPQVVSVGDVLVAAGVALMLVMGAPRTPATVAPRPARPYVGENAQESGRDERTIA